MLNTLKAMFVLRRVMVVAVFVTVLLTPTPSAVPVSNGDLIALSGQGMFPDSQPLAGLTTPGRSWRRDPNKILKQLQTYPVLFVTSLSTVAFAPTDPRSNKLLRLLFQDKKELMDYISSRTRAVKRQRQCYWSVISCF